MEHLVNGESVGLYKVHHCRASCVHEKDGTVLMALLFGILARMLFVHR
jgi:hypothetical protein